MWSGRWGLDSHNKWWVVRAAGHPAGYGVQAATRTCLGPTVGDGWGVELTGFARTTVRTGGAFDAGDAWYVPPEEEERSMDEAEFQKRLSELVSEIETLPAGERERLRQLAAETKDRHEQIKKSVRSLQESIDFLRLGIKYMMFDLEATRRENGYLRKMLEQDPNNGNSDNDAKDI